MIKKKVLGDPHGMSPESYWPEAEKYISSKSWNDIVPSTYTNKDWLASGDSLLDGIGVKDSSDRVHDTLSAGRYLNARSFVINRMDSGLRRNLWDSHVWYSDSQGTFVADFPRPNFPDTRQEDLLFAKAVIEVLKPVLGSSYIRECPHPKMEAFIKAFDDVINDSEMATYYTDPIDDSVDEGKGTADMSWFLTVVIDEGGNPLFDVIRCRSLREARWSCTKTTLASGIPLDDCTALGPYTSLQDAMFAKDYYSQIPIDGLSGSEYLGRLEDLSGMIGKHDFTGMDS